MSQRKKEEKKWVEEVWGFELAPSGFGGDSTVGNSHSEYRMVAALINAPTVQEKKNSRAAVCSFPSEANANAKILAARDRSHHSLLRMRHSIHNLPRARSVSRPTVNLRIPIIPTTFDDFNSDYFR